MKPIRHLAALLLTALLVLTGAPLQAQEQPAILFVNGARLEAPVAQVGGRTLVPLRAIFEALGADVTWDGTTQTAHATWSGGTISLPIGAESATVDGITQRIDPPAQLIAGQTMVPLRFVGESMGAQVGWYPNTRLITVNRAPTPLIPATVSRVVDGDTVELTMPDGRSEKLRLIGIDTPETVHPTKGVEQGGKEASDYTKARLTGQAVLIELDVEERDRYGRLLGYIYLSDGSMFNAILADEGLAQTATYPPNVRYVDLFTALQTGARQGQVGLWAEEGPSAPAAPAAPPVPAVVDGVKIRSITSPVRAGANATVVAETTPGAQCSITVTYKSGLSTAAGLHAKQADTNGTVFWTWLVGSRTTPGNWPVAITCGGKRVQTSITVQ